MIQSMNNQDFKEYQRPQEEVQLEKEWQQQDDEEV